MEEKLRMLGLEVAMGIQNPHRPQKHGNGSGLKLVLKSQKKEQNGVQDGVAMNLIITKVYSID